MTIKSMFDMIITEDHPTVIEIANDEGPMAAGEFLSIYNNQCIQYAGFEEFIVNNKSHPVPKQLCSMAALSTNDKH